MLKISGKEGRPYSILLRGCGFMIPYQAGVLSALQDLSPDIMKSAYRIYGSSSGSVISSLGLCGCDVDEVKEYLLSRLKTSFWGLVPGGGIHKLLKDALQKFLPPNAHELLSGKLHIVLTRLHDWRNVTVSDFASNEELIQAVMCSCYVPVYFGFSPPKYRGVRYVDGELAMWRANFVSRSTITISAFAGEYDICPRDGPAAFLTFQLADCIMQISKMNICRLKNILLVPKRQVMDRFLIEGYQDTVSFLKRLRDFQVNYFEGFTLSLANESIQKGEETLLLKPQMRVLHSRATDHEDDTTENSGISQQKMKKRKPHTPSPPPARASSATEEHF
uniref:Patatin-like phospholipase domain-containing protein 1 n=2 Tax=Cyanistes caeruleus TaxID=156563 RepID=A0A8C0UA07_CYACU